MISAYSFDSWEKMILFENRFAFLFMFWIWSFFGSVSLIDGIRKLQSRRMMV